MSLDCPQLRTCADLLHEAAAARMEEAVQQGRHQLGYVERLHTVVKLEEAAADVERVIVESC